MKILIFLQNRQSNKQELWFTTWSAMSVLCVHTHAISYKVLIDEAQYSDFSDLQ